MIHATHTLLIEVPHNNLLDSSFVSKHHTHTRTRLLSVTSLSLQAMPARTNAYAHPRQPRATWVAPAFCRTWLHA